MKKMLFATIADVEASLANYKLRVAAKPELEKLDGKKLAVVVETLAKKSNVPKLLLQAHGHGESNWAKNVMNNNHDGCTADNKLEKIKTHILSTSAYINFINNPDTREDAEEWMKAEFPEKAEDQAA